MMAYVNGRLPSSALSSIGNGYYMERHAAAAFRAMAAEAQRRWGRPIRVISGYRTYSRQVYFWNLWRSGRGNLAARPGTSNHGWGLAVDLASQWDRWAVDQIGRRFGFAKAWSDAQSEWWHIKYRAGVWSGKVTPAFKTLRHGQKGPSIKKLQIRLRKIGFKSVRASGFFGVATVSAVKRFQRKHRLKADGVYGPKTHAALLRVVR